MLYRIWFSHNGTMACVDVIGTDEQDAINRASMVRPTKEYKYKRTEVIE